MAGRFALVLACGCARLWLAPAMAPQEDLETSIPLEAWEAAACSANGGSDEDCQLHLLQVHARGLTAGVNATDGASAEAKDLAVHDVSIGSGVQNVSAYSTGQCTAQEHAKMTRLGAGSAPGSFPHSVALCAKKALRWFQFHRDDMTRCVSQSLGVSMSCAGCYSFIGQYGYDNCKTQCVFAKWCGSGCLTCTKRSYPTVDKCAGLVAPMPSVC